MGLPGRKMGVEALTTLNKKAFKKRMSAMGEHLKLDQKIKIDLERLNELQKLAGTTEEELDILKTKFTVYFQLLPYLMPKLQAIAVEQTIKKDAISDEEAKQQLLTMLRDNPEIIDEKQSNTTPTLPQ